MLITGYFWIPRGKQEKQHSLISGACHLCGSKIRQYITLVIENKHETHGRGNNRVFDKLSGFQFYFHLQLKPFRIQSDKTVGWVPLSASVLDIETFNTFKDKKNPAWRFQVQTAKDTVKLHFNAKIHCTCILIYISNLISLSVNWYTGNKSTLINYLLTKGIWQSTGWRGDVLACARHERHEVQCRVYECVDLRAGGGGIPLFYASCLL